MIRRLALPAALLVALAVLASGMPPAAADPVTDVRKWLGCADYIVEESLKSVEAWRTYAADAERQVKCKLKVRAQPIKIQRDSDLYLVNAAGVIVPNEANGVVGGTGTAADPFVIGGFEFDGRVVSCPAISVTNVQNYHIRIAGNWIHDMRCGSEHGGPTLVLEHIPKQPIVENNVFSAVKRSMSIYGAYKVIVRNNIVENSYGVREPITGVALAQGSAWSWYGALYVSNSYGAQITGNVIRHGPSQADNYAYGIGSIWNMDVRINNNHVTSATIEGIFNIGVQGYNIISGNTVIGTTTQLANGIRTESGGYTSIHDNRICNAYYPVVGGQNVYNNYC